MTLATLLLIIALILFIVSACGVSSRINLTAAGLACCVAAVLVESPLLG
jgi:hypothetical protein